MVIVRPASLFMFGGRFLWFTLVRSLAALDPSRLVLPSLDLSLLISAFQVWSRSGPMILLLFRCDLSPCLRHRHIRKNVCGTMCVLSCRIMKISIGVPLLLGTLAFLEENLIIVGWPGASSICTVKGSLADELPCLAWYVSRFLGVWFSGCFTCGFPFLSLYFFGLCSVYRLLPFHRALVSGDILFFRRHMFVIFRYSLW